MSIFFRPDMADFLPVAAGTEVFGQDIQDENLYGPGLGEFLPVPAGTETFGQDVSDELLYQQKSPGLGDGDDGDGPGPGRAEVLGDDDLMFGQPVETALMRGVAVRWKFGGAAAPQWAYGDEDLLGPQDYVQDGDEVPRWLALERPGPSRGWPKCDPRPGAAGDVWNMDARGRRSGMTKVGQGFAYGLGDSPGIRRRVNRGAQGMGDSFLSTLAGTAIKQIVFKSQITPPVTIQPFGNPAAGQPTATAQPTNAFTDMVLGFAKPAFYVQTPGGVVPIEPYGEPTTDYSGPVTMGLTVMAFASAWVGYKIVRKLLS